MSLDVTASEAELDAKIQEALKIYDGIDVLANNAGYIEAGLIEDIRFVFPNLCCFICESVNINFIQRK